MALYGIVDVDYVNEYHAITFTICPSYEYACMCGHRWFWHKHTTMTVYIDNNYFLSLSDEEMKRFFSNKARECLWEFRKKYRAYHVRELGKVVVGMTLDPESGVIRITHEEK